MYNKYIFTRLARTIEGDYYLTITVYKVIEYPNGLITTQVKQKVHVNMEFIE